MDYLNISSKKIELVHNKRIGRVLFVVEGNKTEMDIIHRLFCEILGYSFVSKNRELTECKYINEKDPFSVVYVLNSKNSNINSLSDYDELVEQVTEFITANYEQDFAIENASIYYIFDRDYRSNQQEIVEELMKIFSNSRDAVHDYERQGLLLLSYPCVEAFFMECLMNNYERFSFDVGKKLKPFLERRKKTTKKLTEENIIIGFRNMIEMLHKVGVDTYDVDNFSSVNRQLYDYQEDYIENNGYYRMISLLTFALVDLGLINITNEDVVVDENGNVCPA